MLMKLYFTRHGRTVWNQEMRFQGMYGDSPLLSESYDEVRLLGNSVKSIPFSKIITSPSLRTVETAKTINQALLHPVPIEETKGLREIGMGELEGVSIEESNRRYKEELQLLRARSFMYNPSQFNGETIESVVLRSVEAVKRAMQENATSDYLLFVTHGYTLSVCIQSLLGIPLQEIQDKGSVKNNSLTILESVSIDEPFQLIQWNDTSFLN